MDSNITPGKPIGAAIQLKEFHVIKVEFYRQEDLESESSKHFNLAIRQGIPTEAPLSSFHITLSLELFFPDSKFKLKIDLLGLFTSQDVVIDDKFMTGPFVRVNAPAILYPYLRAFVSSFMATAGFKTPILPSINFAQVLQPGRKD
jgi:preprotein translocase subunit SecB